MSDAGASANRFQVNGRVATEPETRFTPAGIPITRFILEHRSQQVEAGLPREASFRIMVICAGKALAKQVESLSIDQLVQVEGFITRENYRDADRRLALHAELINLMDA